jgi:hypothetical protein
MLRENYITTFNEEVRVAFAMMPNARAYCQGRKVATFKLPRIRGGRHWDHHDAVALWLAPRAIKFQIFSSRLILGINRRYELRV